MQLRRVFALGVLAGALSFSGQLCAEPAKLVIAASSSSGSYHEMLDELKQICHDENLELVEAPSNGGATENLEALGNNKVHAAFLHSDVIAYMSQGNSALSRLQTLIALWPEEVHVVVHRHSKTTTGSTLGFGGSTVEFNKLADLRGYTVGAAGGGVITAKNIKNLAEGGYEVVAYNSGKELFEALRNDQIQAAIVVGGAPLKVIQDLNASDFKLISVDESLTSRLQGVYTTTSVSYSNLKAHNVRTIAPMALMVVRDLKTPRFRAGLASLQQCFHAKLPELHEMVGTHPKWQEIKLDDHGPWPNFLNLLGESTVVPTTSAPAAIGSPAPLGRRKS